jgi:UDPglucose--hexose-1-phosphate uridylyltransferase
LRKTSSRLADGREIIYFDESDDAAASRIMVDSRDLPPIASLSTNRYDALVDEWVTVAPHRQGRTHLPPADECPLCPSRPGHQTEIPSPDYDVVVFENRFPSFAGAEPAPGTPALNGFSRLRPGAGRCEVVCFTPEHDTSFAALAPTRVRTVLEAWVDRTVALEALPSVAQVFCFENRGREIGVTLGHPHGQIYGYPFVTPRTARMLAAARRYRDRTTGNLFADLLRAEIQVGERIVARTAHWTVFVPYAARWPIDIRLYPNDPVTSLPGLSEEQRQDFCQVYLETLRRLHKAYGADAGYIAGWHQAPAAADADLAYLHLEILSLRRAPGKLKYLAGSEAVMGAFLNDIAPEDAARILRDAL